VKDSKLETFNLTVRTKTWRWNSRRQRQLLSRVKLAGEALIVEVASRLRSIPLRQRTLGGVNRGGIEPVRELRTDYTIREEAWSGQDRAFTRNRIRYLGEKSEFFLRHMLSSYQV